MYLRRNNTEKFWPVARKGTKYLARPKHEQKGSMSLVVVMRDVLKLVKNRKELKKLLNEKQIKINGKEIRETSYPVSLFDIIGIPGIKKNFKAVLSEHKKMTFEEVSEKHSETKIFKLMNKKILPGKKVQLNLNHGKNIITSEKAEIGDSLLVDLKNNKIVKVIPLEKGRNAFVINGKHAGYTGKIEDIVVRGDKKIAKIKSDEGKVNVWVKNIIVIE